MFGMANDQPMPRDTPLPGQESVDLDPVIPAEPEQPEPGGDSTADQASGAPAEQPDPADTDPELGNTLISPENS
jgi:hypothetical protein